MRPVLLIVLLVVLSVAARELLTGPVESPTASSNASVAEGQAGSLAESVSKVAEGEAESDAIQALEPQLGARRIVRVPGEAPEQEAAPDLESWSVEDRYLEAYAKHNLELALANDLAAAFRIEMVQERCREVPESLAELDQYIERRISMYAWFQADNPRFTAPSVPELRKRNLDRFEGCQFFKELFNNDLRKTLAGLAAQGHVTARYMYAVWPPVIKGQPDAFFVHQEWAEKSLAFSLANLAEGEVAGLMAFAQSYQKAGMFTTSDHDMGMAFQIAAQDCGLEMPILVMKVEHFLSEENHPPFREDTRPAVLAMAEGLKGLCLQ